MVLTFAAAGPGLRCGGLRFSRTGGFDCRWNLASAFRGRFLGAGGGSSLPPAEGLSAVRCRLVLVLDVLDRLLGRLFSSSGKTSSASPSNAASTRTLLFLPRFLGAPGTAYGHRRRRSRGRIGLEEGTQLLFCLQLAIDDAQEQPGNHLVITRDFRRDPQFLQQGMGNLLPRLRPHGKEVLIFRLDGRGFRSQAQPQNGLWVGRGEQLPGGGRRRRLFAHSCLLNSLAA